MTEAKYEEAEELQLQRKSIEKILGRIFFRVGHQTMPFVLDTRRQHHVVQETKIQRDLPTKNGCGTTMNSLYPIHYRHLQIKARVFSQAFAIP